MAQIGGLLAFCLLNCQHKIDNIKSTVVVGCAFVKRRCGLEREKVMTSKSTSCWLVFLGLMAAFAKGDFDSGSDGSDGAFNPTQSIEIDLGLAATGTWNTPSPVPGQGVYDPQQWAVVFKYTTIDIPAGVTVTFKNHRSGAPVVWLAQGNLIIAGYISLDGQDGHQPNMQPYFSEAGPGGFGGTAIGNAGGFGPGGGNLGQHGSFGDGPSPYGNDAIIPLIGGSGGGLGSDVVSGSGAGGGAILMASSESIDIQSSGAISTYGGFAAAYGRGSGGAVRLIADTIIGSGFIIAHNGGYPGRIRIEADQNLFGGGTVPVYSFSQPGQVFAEADLPTLKVTSISGLPVPSDPAAGIETADLEIDTAAAVTLTIEATNVPVGRVVQVRIVPAQGAVIYQNSSPLVDFGGGMLFATASVVFPSGPSEVQLRVTW